MDNVLQSNPVQNFSTPRRTAQYRAATPVAPTHYALRRAASKRCNDYGVSTRKKRIQRINLKEAAYNSTGLIYQLLIRSIRR